MSKFKVRPEIPGVFGAAAAKRRLGSPGKPDIESSPTSWPLERGALPGVGGRWPDTGNWSK